MQTTSILAGTICQIKGNKITLLLENKTIAELEYDPNDEDFWVGFEYNEQSFDLNVYNDEFTELLKSVIYGCEIVKKEVQTNSYDFIKIQILQ